MSQDEGSEGMPTTEAVALTKKDTTTKDVPLGATEPVREYREELLDIARKNPISREDQTKIQERQKYLFNQIEKEAQKSDGNQLPKDSNQKPQPTPQPGRLKSFLNKFFKSSKG